MRMPNLLPMAVAAVLAGALFAPDAEAQKLYRWVDEDGKVHYSQSLPPEAVDRARRELSARSGMTTSEVGRALTDEERAEAEAEAAILEASRKLAEERAQRDQVLISSYSSERDLQRTYDERFSLVDETLKATRVGIDSQRQTLASLLASAADREFGGQVVDARTRESIRETHGHLSSQQTLMQRREAERAVLEAEFEQTLARYRELKGETPAQRSGGDDEPAAAPAVGDDAADDAGTAAHG